MKSINIDAISAIDDDKARKLRWMVKESASIQAWIAKDKTCEFLVSNVTNPANIYDPAGQDGTLFIRISKWFIQGYSAGYIAGMLCHEVGAHFLASAKMKADSNWDQEVNSGTSKEKIKDQLTGWSYEPMKANQPDHIFAACSPQPRYEAYRAIFIEFATIIAKDIASSFGAPFFTAGDLTDLLDCWLMDISSILATTDRRGRGPLMANYVATAYNAHLAELQRKRMLLTTNTVLRDAINTQSKQSWSGVLGAYSAMAWWLLPDYGVFETLEAMSG
jgi:hypothetical protein